MSGDRVVVVGSSAGGTGSGSFLDAGFLARSLDEGLQVEAKGFARCKETVNELIAAHGQRLVGWREVPTDPDGADIGPTARAGMPHIEMLIVAAGDSTPASLAKCVQLIDEYDAGRLFCGLFK